MRPSQGRRSRGSVTCGNRSTGADRSDRRREPADERGLAIDRRRGTMLPMALIAIFLMGIGNFALHKAVLVSGHRLLGQIGFPTGPSAGRITLAVEFLILLAAMLGAANGWPQLAWGYFLYTLANGLSAWLILTGRV